MLGLRRWHTTAASEPAAASTPRSGKIGCGKISASGQAVDHLVERLMRERMRTTQVEYATKTAWEKEGELTEIKTKIRQLLKTFSNASGEAAEQALAEVARLNDEAEKLRLERGEWLRAPVGAAPKLA